MAVWSERHVMQLDKASSHTLADCLIKVCWPSKDFKQEILNVFFLSSERGLSLSVVAALMVSSLLFMERELASSEGRSPEPPSVVSDEELLFREITKRSIISNCMVMAGNVFWHQIAKSAYVAIMIKWSRERSEEDTSVLQSHLNLG